MPDTNDTAEKPIVYYDQPCSGQRFVRYEGPHKYVEGHIAGLTVDGQHPGPDGAMRDAWYAVLQYDTTQEYRFNFQTRIVEGAVQWMPIPDPDSNEALRDGLQELRAEVVDLTLKLEALRLVACDPVDATPETVEPNLVDEPEATGRRRRRRTAY